MSEKDLFKLTFQVAGGFITEVCERRFLDETKRKHYSTKKKCCLIKQEPFNP
jgi:hypothetical protein